MGGEPVSTTVVDSKSTEAARGSPVADPILESAPVELLGAPTDEAASDTAVSDAGVLGEDSDVLDDEADADVVGPHAGHPVHDLLAHSETVPGQQRVVEVEHDAADAAGTKLKGVDVVELGHAQLRQ